MQPAEKASARALGRSERLERSEQKETRSESRGGCLL